MRAKGLPFAPFHESGAQADQSVFGEQSAKPVSSVWSEPRRSLTRGQSQDPPGVRRRQPATVAGPKRSTPLDVDHGDDGAGTEPARSQVAGPDEVIDSPRADAQPFRGLRDGEVASWRDSINHSNVRIDDAICECKTLDGSNSTGRVRRSPLASGAVRARRDFHTSSHPGAVFVVVRTGTLTVWDEDCVMNEYSQGETFFEAGPDHPMLVKNVGATDVTLYVTYLVPEGTPATGLRIPQPDRCGVQ